MKRKFEVYLITNRVTGKQYVGKTINGHMRRWRAHTHSVGCKALSAAMAKYGRDSFKIECLYEGVSEREINAVEKAMIAQYGTYFPNGYNLTSGGEGMSGYRFSKEESEKRKSRARRPQCPIVCVETGQEWESMAECARSFSGKGLTQLRRCVNSATRTYFGFHFVDKDGGRTPLPSPGKASVPVQCVETGKTWRSQTSCVLELGNTMATSHLYKCLDKPTRTYRGLHFVTVSA